MGWFEEQVKQRKKLDEKTFEESFMSLAGLKVDNKEKLSDTEIRDNFVIKQILSYFHHQPIDIPKGVEKFDDKLNYVISQCDFVYRKITLNDSFVNSSSLKFLSFNSSFLIGSSPNP